VSDSAPCAALDAGVGFRGGLVPFAVEEVERAPRGGDAPALGVARLPATALSCEEGVVERAGVRETGASPLVAIVGLVGMSTLNDLCG
jgi:hypothetical protein